MSYWSYWFSNSPLLEALKQLADNGLQSTKLQTHFCPVVEAVKALWLNSATGIHYFSNASSIANAWL